MNLEGHWEAMTFQFGSVLYGPIQRRKRIAEFFSTRASTVPIEIGKLVMLFYIKLLLVLDC